MALAELSVGQRQRGRVVGVVDDVAAAGPDERSDLLEVGRDVEPTDAGSPRLERGRARTRRAIQPVSWVTGLAAGSAVEARARSARVL